MSTSFNKRSFAARLRRELRRSPKTQREVARLLRVSDNRVSEWANARAVPSVPQLARLSAILAVDPTWLLTGRSSPVANQALVKELLKIAPSLERLGSQAKRLQKSTGQTA